MITRLINDNSCLAETAERLSVVVEENFPPFVQVKNGEVVGSGIEILNAAARRASVQLEYLPAPASDIQAIIAEGKADAVFPMAINAVRLASFDFSEPFLTTGGALFVAAPSTTPEDLRELSGKKVATPGTGPLATFIRTNAPNTILIETRDYVEPLRMVVSGEADAAALNLQAGSMLVENLYPGRIILPVVCFLTLPLALGLPKGNKEKLSILRRLSDAIRSIQDEGILRSRK
jgi:polar amino acid transport system substrate-binding protein